MKPHSEAPPAIKLPGAAATCDPVALWRAIPQDAQARLGAIAIATMLAYETVDEHGADIAAYRAFEHIAGAAYAELSDLIAEACIAAYHPSGEPLRPDLNTLGIRQCTSCGCTDHFGCTPPCAWATPTTCTACFPPAQEA